MRHIQPMRNPAHAVANPSALLLRRDRCDDDRRAPSIDSPVPARVAKAVRFHRKDKVITFGVTFRIGERRQVHHRNEDFAAWSRERYRR